MTHQVPFPDRLDAARRYAESRVIRAELVETITALLDDCDHAPDETAEAIAAAVYDAAVDSLAHRLGDTDAAEALALYMADLALGPELGR